MGEVLDSVTRWQRSGAKGREGWRLEGQEGGSGRVARQACGYHCRSLKRQKANVLSVNKLCGKVFLVFLLYLTIIICSAAQFHNYLEIQRDSVNLFLFLSNVLSSPKDSSQFYKATKHE